MSCIRLKKPTPIGLHFNQAGHSLKHFTILAIEQFDDNSEAIRQMKESTWQHLLQTAHPLGININVDFYNKLVAGIGMCPCIYGLANPNP